tara:strand:+ start:166 stop:1431 length:1266 start_codon:yes stop_codon:yes gene_type:complete
MYTADHLNPSLIDDDGNYVLNRVAFSFGQYYDVILNNKTPTIELYGISLPSLRRPVLPHSILFLYENITTNFILIHLIKNFFFGIIIFYLIKNFNHKYNYLFLSICLFIIFYNPHNAVTNLGTENEEGILNYLIIILFFLLISEYKFKSIYLSIVLCLIFLLKGSMFLLSIFIPIIFLLVEKKTKYKYLPIVILIITNISWGLINMKTSGFFAIGPKGSAMNAINLATITHKHFNITYPEIRPDIHRSHEVEKIVLANDIKTEKELINVLLSNSKKYILENPYEYFIGVLKKIYVLNFSPFKDAQYPKDPAKYMENIFNAKHEANEKIYNPIRYSNIPNKIVFNLSLVILLFSVIKFKNNSNFMNKLNLYYLFILALYLAPYMFAWIYPRHATSIYILSHFYLVIVIIEKNIFNIRKFITS